MKFPGTPVSQTHSYRPISCSAYDVLEAAAIRHSPLRLTLAEGDDIQQAEAIVLDLFAREGAEYARILIARQERIVRLDALRQIVDETGKEYDLSTCTHSGQS